MIGTFLDTTINLLFPPVCRACDAVLPVSRDRLLCETCAGKIPMARLNALPYATFCIECQREAERDGIVGGAEADWSRIIDSNSGDSELSINDIELDVS